MNTITQESMVCHHCHKNARWNTPALDDEGNLWCNQCVDNDRTGFLFRSVEQRKTDNGEYVFTGGMCLNGVVVWKDGSTWTDGGNRSVRLTEDEKKLPPMEIALLINEEHNVQGLTRCTGCGVKMTHDQIAGYPLFAGVCCAPCMKKHNEHLNEERRKGHVCGMCHQPYGNCCC